MSHFISDLRSLTVTTLLAIYTATAYFKCWAMMDITIGTARAGYALMMGALACACIASVAAAIGIALVATLEAIDRRSRRKHIASHRLVPVRPKAANTNVPDRLAA